MSDLILFGMQGSGKGTQGQRISEQLGLQVFEMGAQLRRLATEDSVLGREVKKITTAGQLVPNEIVMKIVARFLAELPADNGVIFDGIPRNEEQRVSLETEFQKVHRQPIALLIEISRTEALRRLLGRKTCAGCHQIFGTKDNLADTNECPSCGGELRVRADDTAEAIEMRLAVYEKETRPTIEKYRAQQRLIEVDGLQELTAVTAEILQKLTARISEQ